MENGNEDMKLKQAGIARAKHAHLAIFDEQHQRSAHPLHMS
jgi:hypothetical protein